MPSIAARKDGSFKAASTAPSINKTQVGNAVVPLPYPTTQDLSGSVGVVPTVRFNGKPAYVLSQATQPSCKGDDAGKMTGVKSGKVNGEVKPVSASTTVKAGTKYVVRNGDKNTMNGGNNPGVYLTSAVSASMPAKSATGGADQSPAKDAKPAEQGFMDKVKAAVHDLAKDYKDNMSGSLHDAAGKAMSVGGKVAGGGGLTMAAGAGVAATGVGLPAAAVMEVGGGAAVTVGGVVGGTGSVVEGGATALDSAADWVLTGKAPDVVGTAVGIVKNAVINRITNMIPGGRAIAGEAQALKSEAKAEINAAKNEAKVAKNEADAAKKEADAAKKEADAAKKEKKEGKKQEGGGDGTTVKGDGKDGGRCRLRPYKEGCPSGETPHHVVPDHCFKQPGDDGAYYHGTIKHADGLCVCVGGSTKSTTPDGSRIKRGKLSISDFISRLAPHGKIHAIFDPLETALGEIGTPKGTATLGEMEALGARTVGGVTGCDPANLQKQLRDYHQAHGMPANTKVRADPFGQYKNLDASHMGVPNRTQGGAGLD